MNMIMNFLVAFLVAFLLAFLVARLVAFHMAFLVTFLVTFLVVRLVAKIVTFLVVFLCPMVFAAWRLLSGISSLFFGTRSLAFAIVGRTGDPCTRRNPLPDIPSVRRTLAARAY